MSPRKGAARASQKKIDLAVNLFRSGEIGVGEVCLITGLDRAEVEKLFQERGIAFAKTILICGGAGFIGSNFVHYTLDKYPNYKVVNFDLLTYAGNPDNVRDLEANPRYTFVKGDIASKPQVDEVFSKYKPDYVVNFAAQTHVDRSLHDSVAPFIMTNVFGVYILLEATRKHKPEKFIHFSTDEVYGSVELGSPIKFTEEYPFKPNVPYAASKAGGDLMCRAYFESFKAPVIVTHCSNNYGPYQYPEKFIPFLTLRALEGKPLPLYGDGRHVRDWLYVYDNCSAVDVILQRGSPGEVYNIAASNEWANLDIAREIVRVLNRPESLIKFVEDRPGHDRRYSLDISKIKKDLDWTPSNGFREVLPKTIMWYAQNPAWVEGVRRRNGEFNPHIKI